MTHLPLCDEDHTARQACNSALATAASGPLIVSQPATRTPPQEILEAPPTPVAKPARSTSRPEYDLPREQDLEAPPTPRSPAATGTMPEPSPWASRAWEDTAAAVGATASPAPPPTLVNPQSVPATSIRSLPLIGGMAALLVVLLLVARLVRRRSGGVPLPE